MNGINYYRQYSLKCEKCKDEITFVWMMTKKWDRIPCNCHTYECIYRDYSKSEYVFEISSSLKYEDILIKPNNIIYNTYYDSAKFDTLNFNGLNYDDSDLNTISFEKLFNRFDKLKNII